MDAHETPVYEPIDQREEHLSDHDRNGGGKVVADKTGVNLTYHRRGSSVWILVFRFRCAL